MKSSRHRSKARKGLTSFAKDEHNNQDAIAETRTRLKPLLCKDSKITADNAPDLNRAGAAVIVADSGGAKKLGLEPLARRVAYGIRASTLECETV